MKTVYLIGSLRNERVPELGKILRNQGFDTFDDWHSAGPEADDYFQQYRLARGWSYQEALDSYAAKHIFNFDKTHLDRADFAVLVLPAGKSGHLELGYFIGSGKPGFILFDKEPERFDQMYAFATKVVFSNEELVNALVAASQEPEQLPVSNGVVVSYPGDPRKYPKQPMRQ